MVTSLSFFSSQIDKNNELYTRMISMFNMLENAMDFKKLQAKRENEQSHIACLLCYEHVITDTRYQICPNCTKLNTAFSIFFWFQCESCKLLNFQYSLAQIVHFSTHPLIKFCKDYVSDCSTCKKIFETPN